MALAAHSTTNSNQTTHPSVASVNAITNSGGVANGSDGHITLQQQQTLQQQPQTTTWSLISVSNQLIVWDVASGELTRVINPNIEGVFLGLALSADARYAAAYTNNNQLVLACAGSTDSLCRSIGAITTL